MKKTFFLIGLFLATLIAGTGMIYYFGAKFLTTSPEREVAFTPEAPLAEVPPELKKPNYQAPEIILKNMKEEKINLSSFKNKTVVLSFWTTWNPLAKDQLVVLDSYAKKMKGRGIEILAVANQEDKSVVYNFLRRETLDVPVYLDEEGAAGEIYRITVLPMTYFISRDGRVKDVYIGLLNENELHERVAKVAFGNE
jgi:peroxiredoxin